MRCISFLRLCSSPKFSVLNQHKFVISVSLGPKSDRGKMVSLLVSHTTEIKGLSGLVFSFGSLVPLFIWLLAESSSLWL